MDFRIADTFTDSVARITLEEQKIVKTSAFEVLNLGRYERQACLNLSACLPARGAQAGHAQAGVAGRLTGKKKEQALARKEQEFRDLILKAYRAEPLGGGSTGYAATEAGQGQPGALSSSSPREERAGRGLRRGASRVDVLAFEFEMGLFPAVLDEAKHKGIDLAPKTIPPEVFDKRAVEKGQVRFHDAANIFENEWQSFRTRQSRDLELTSANHTYAKPGRYTIAVKVIDIFGNDTMTLVPVTAG